jgi:nucleotide-binding universal stress UspA family protein
MELRTVVVGLDFSEASIDAATWIGGFFAPESALILAHVVEPVRRPSFVSDRPEDREAIQARERAGQERLEQLAASISPRPARTIVRTGRPHEELARLSGEVGADLIVVGAHGDRPRPWKMLGTTAERLVRSARPAVLVASGRMEGAPKRMLVAVDDGPDTARVLAWARDLSKGFGAAVSVLHVLSTAAMSHVLSATAATIRSDWERLEAVSDEMRAEAERWLEALTAHGPGARADQSIVRHGKAGDVILETASEIGADVIVMGRRGTSTVLPAVLGSTVSTVLHGASCPVLVVTEAAEDWIIDEPELP